MDEATLARLVVALIMERHLCLLCIGQKVGADPDAARQCLERIGTTIVVVEDDRQCHACGRGGPVYSLPNRLA